MDEGKVLDDVLAPVGEMTLRRNSFGRGDPTNGVCWYEACQRSGGHCNGFGWNGWLPSRVWRVGRRECSEGNAFGRLLGAGDGGQGTHVSAPSRSRSVDARNCGMSFGGGRDLFIEARVGERFDIFYVSSAEVDEWFRLRAATVNERGFWISID
jgi:hypothetical protein